MNYKGFKHKSSKKSLDLKLITGTLGLSKKNILRGNIAEHRTKKIN